MKNVWTGLRKLSLEWVLLSLAFLIILNIPDYWNPPCTVSQYANGAKSVYCWDIFRNGKFRYIFLTLAPFIFVFYSRVLHWAPALYLSFLWSGWVLQNYQIIPFMALATSFGVCSLAAAFRRFPEDLFKRVLVVSGVLNAAIACMQRFGLHILYEPATEAGRYAASGLYGHPTILGPFLVLCLAPALWSGWYVAAAPILLAIFLTGSTMTYASLGVLLLIWIWYKVCFRSAFWAGYLSLIFLGCYAWFVHGQGEFLSLSGRDQYWAAAWRAFMDSPIYGHGPGSWLSSVMPKYLGPVGPHVVFQVHSDPLEILVEYGLILALPLAYAFLVFLRGLKPTWRHASCCAILVNSLGNFPMQIASIALIFLIEWSQTLTGGKLGGPDSLYSDLCHDSRPIRVRCSKGFERLRAYWAGLLH